MGIVSRVGVGVAVVMYPLLADLRRNQLERVHCRCK